MKTRRWTGLVLGALLSAACVSVDLYEAPTAGEAYASLDGEDVHELFEMGRHMVVVASIDGRIVPHEPGAPDISVRPVGSADAIALRPGERELLVRGCAYKFKALVNAGWYCAETLIFLEAQAGGEYRLQYDFDDKNRYLTVWVVNRQTRARATQPLRLELLERMY